MEKDPSRRKLAKTNHIKKELVIESRNKKSCFNKGWVAANETMDLRIQLTRVSTLEVTRHLICDLIMFEINKLKEYCGLVEDEKRIIVNCLKKCKLIKQNLRDKPTIAHNAIQYLEQKTKNEFKFIGVTNKVDLVL